MLCTFTTSEGRTLVVRSDDIRAIEDRIPSLGESFLIWMINDERQDRVITGTALDNRDRIQQEELDLIDRVNQHHLKAQAQAQFQQQMAAQLPKVARGKQAK